MGTLRKQMQADKALRGLAYRTGQAYIESVAKLAKFYGKSPDQISEPECQRYLLHLLEERKLAHSSCNIMCSALTFFYRVTLQRRAFLMTTYGAGLRLMEACQIKVCDIDSQRMTLRVEQGKGAKDRYTLLSPRLLQELLRYWFAQRTRLWLFPGVRDGEHPMAPKSAQRLFHAAKDRAGITKDCGIHGLRHAFAIDGDVPEHLLVQAVHH